MPIAVTGRHGQGLGSVYTSVGGLPRRRSRRIFSANDCAQQLFSEPAGERLAERQVDSAAFVHIENSVVTLYTDVFKDAKLDWVNVEQCVVLECCSVRPVEIFAVQAWVDTICGKTRGAVDGCVSVNQKPIVDAPKMLICTLERRRAAS